MASTQPELHLVGGGIRSGGAIFTIPPTEPFLEALARAVLSGDLPKERGAQPGALDLPTYEIYLPNRAACRALSALFLQLSPHRATLLPRIRPLGSAEEDTLLFLRDEEGQDFTDHPDLPVAPAIGALDRRIALTSLVQAWARQLREGYIANSPAAASELALELMRLMDEAETEQVDLTRLAELVPERFASHEQLSLDFLKIVIQIWPDYLADNGLLNPVDRRNRIMALEAERLRRTAPETPVIIAGSTGSIPVTAALMKAVAGLPNGAIVLPGLDLRLDAPSWDSLAEHPEHPQAGLYNLLGELETDREAVRYLPGTHSDGEAAARAALVSEALRPAATLGAWPAFMESAPLADIRRSLDGVSLVTAPTEQDEAAAIALILREAMEEPGKTANLVTQDRTLARRVAAELGRWDLRLEASGGEPLLTTEAGIFHELIAEAAATGDQIALLSLLKHPSTHLGLTAGEARHAAQLIEIAAMRQPWCGSGVEALAASLLQTEQTKPRHAAIDRLSEADWAAAHAAVATIRQALEPLTALAGSDSTLGELAAAHAESAARFSQTGDEDGPQPDISPDAAALTGYLSALAALETPLSVGLSDYPALFRSLTRLESVRPTRSTHPRLQILNAMEARLTSADLVILAGMNEGNWPEAADPGPWLNRAMREALGLPSPERKTRLAGHDVWQMLGAPQLVMTRALKSEGTPTVPSRWLMRLQALLKGLGLPEALRPPRPWLAWAATRSQAAAPAPSKPPAPCPPLAARPRTLSVSDIEKLIANPYTIYARHILGLSPLNPLAGEPGGAEKGQIIHEVMHRFARRFRDRLPNDIVGILLAIFDDCAALYGERANIHAYWRPRMERFARWFAETEAARRGEAHVFTELRGAFDFDAPGGPFRLRARADRIDIDVDGGLAIYDYKSGGMPSEGAVAAFRAPQLPLEALIACEGGFDGIVSRDIRKLAYISAKGGVPAGEEHALKKQTPQALAEGAREGLAALIARFDNPLTPYRAMRRAAFADAYRFDDYAHLARIAEWAGSEEGEE